jgi:HD superfamily phosphohydrolase
MRTERVADRLSKDFSEILRDPLWGSIQLTEALKALVSSAPFAKLAGIRQLGPAFLAYPGATHSRFAHSLGVYHCARRLALALVSKADLDFVTPEGMSSFLVAALCHDLGHFPYAHSLKELELESHEALGADLMLREPLLSLIAATGADPHLAAAIIDEDLAHPATRELGLFRGLLSGVLDPDKLDYLNRDAYFCGVPYGLQDVDYALQRVDLGPGDRIGVDEKGLMSVESLLFAKYLMYRSVYWNQAVRSATSMVKKAVFLALETGALAPAELYDLDDAGFVALMRGRAFEARPLAEAVFELRPWRLLLDLPFDAANLFQGGLLDLRVRALFEAELAREAGLSPLDLVLDIPEAVSFESDLPILFPETGEALAFSKSTTVFGPAVVTGFATSLRRLRLFAARPDEGLRAAARRRLA